MHYLCHFIYKRNDLYPKNLTPGSFSRFALVVDTFECQPAIAEELYGWSLTAFNLETPSLAIGDLLGGAYILRIPSLFEAITARLLITHWGPFSILSENRLGQRLPGELFAALEHARCQVYNELVQQIELPAYNVLKKKVVSLFWQFDRDPTVDMGDVFTQLDALKISGYFRHLIEKGIWPVNSKLPPIDILNRLREAKTEGMNLPLGDSEPEYFEDFATLCKWEEGSPDGVSPVGVQHQIIQAVFRKVKGMCVVCTAAKAEKTYKECDPMMHGFGELYSCRMAAITSPTFFNWHQLGILTAFTNATVKFGRAELIKNAPNPVNTDYSNLV
ncbi:hypothetical protein M501DRAFT_1017685 [Patellaria atrata CBS 101060]|uniref:Uncharacterized protein n=1 Tax=Patellaria atrata CBS 101060 TaxID=1346257 RepID=A0A9P4S8A1_9PEZI|nr:hypothetical protein M501DRAFT_1017685 [Patellaria atrata CBS 101060]